MNKVQSALDRIWRVSTPQVGSGIWNLLRTRLLSFGLVTGLGFMLTVSLVVSAALAALGTSSLASEFGAAGSFVVLIAWVYYSAQIFLFGAEYTWVYSGRHGSRAPMPTPGDQPAVANRRQHLNRAVTQ